MLALHVMKWTFMCGLLWHVYMQPDGVWTSMFLYSVFQMHNRGCGALQRGRRLHCSHRRRQNCLQPVHSGCWTGPLEEKE